MRSYWISVLGSLTAVILTTGGCTDQWNIDSVQQVSADATPFQSALQQGYVELARTERAERDWRDTAYFVDRARQVASGEDVLPQEVGERELEQTAISELAKARDTLLGLREENAEQRVPEEFARAQVMYDCWLQEQEEGHQADDIGSCRAAHEAAVAAVRKILSERGELVVLLEDEGGGIGTLVVSGEAGEQVLSEPLAAAEVRGEGGPKAIQITRDQVQDIFGDAISARPLPPISYILYFKEGTSDPTDASRPVLKEILDEVGRRQSAEVVVIGHTDREGSVPSNDRLSISRAQSVAEFMVAQGIAEGSIRTEGRGEREPVVQTADGVEEPLNRRAEIVIR